MRNGPVESSPVRGFLVDTVVNAVIPLAVYHVSRHTFGMSETAALVYSAILPVATSLLDLGRHRRLNPVSILVILGIFTSVGALYMGGSPRVLLIRESLLTAVFGLACFVSFLLPRPLMFYFGRHFIAGNNPEKIADFNRNWGIPEVRRKHRLITAVWGCVLVAEFLVRTWMVFRLSTETVLLVAPTLFNATIVLTFLWTMRYARKAQESLPA